MSSWQSIESAPKDGTEVVLGIPLKWGKASLDKKDDRVGTGFYNAGAYWWDSKHYVWRNRIANITTQPTHWMPCPELPSAGSIDPHHSN